MFQVMHDYITEVMGEDDRTIEENARLAGLVMPEEPEKRVGWMIKTNTGEVAFIKSYDASKPHRFRYVVYDRRRTHDQSPPRYYDLRSEWEIQLSQAWLLPPHRGRGRCTRLQDAILCGHEACVRALASMYDDDRYAVLKKLCVRDAAAYGHLDVLRFLVVDMGWPMDGSCLYVAECYGQCDCLKFMNDNRIPIRPVDPEFRGPGYWRPEVQGSYHDHGLHYLADKKREDDVLYGLPYGRNYLDDVLYFLPLAGEPRCDDFVNTLRIVDGFLRDVAPLLDYPEDAAQMCELDKSVLRLMRTKFYTDYPILEGRPARLPRMTRRSPR